MLWLQWVIFLVGVVLQLRLLLSLRHGAYKEYPFVFAYALCLILTSVADRAFGAGLFSLSREMRSTYYYRNEAARQFLLFTVVVSFIEHAMVGKPYRMRVRLFLALAASFSVLVSLYIHSDAGGFVTWMTQVMRDVSFGSVVLTLLLWVMLISSKIKDRQLLTLTGGLGLQFTGEAIGQSLRQLSGGRRFSLMMVGNLTAVLVHLLRLYIWGEAFRTMRPLQETQKEAEEKSQPISPQAETLFESNA